MSRKGKSADQPLSLLDMLEQPETQAQTAQPQASQMVVVQSAASQGAAFQSAVSQNAAVHSDCSLAKGVRAMNGDVQAASTALPWDTSSSYSTANLQQVAKTMTQSSGSNTPSVLASEAKVANNAAKTNATQAVGKSGDQSVGKSAGKKRTKIELPAFEYPMDPLDFVVCGIDEAGRGPLMGDVVAACVILDHRHMIPGIDDSKHLTEKKRDALAPLIKEYALAYGIGRASPQEIDELNILHATYLAMRRAYEAMQVNCDLALIDGNRIPPGLNLKCQAVVKGDARVKEIGAASILAKTTRDADLYALDQQYPEYQFAHHKGYPTAAHMSVLERLPILPCYRFTYGPVKKLIEERNLQILPDHTLAPR